MKLSTASQFIFLTMVFGSCSLVVDVDVPIQEPRLTVNSLFTPDSVWSVALTNSRNILDNETFFRPRTVSEVVILDKSENIVSTLQHTGLGIYRSDQRPEPGKTYSVRINSEGQKTVTARAVVPKPNNILSLKIDTVVIKMEYGTTENIQLEVKFMDPINEVNYYLFSFYEKIVYDSFNPETQEIDRDTITWVLPLSVDSPSLLEDNLSNSIISDSKFNGKEVTIRFKPIFSPPASSLGDAGIITQNLSEEYFRYMTTLDLQRSTDGDPFAQPVKVFNNINNGFGIFAGYSSSYYSIK